MPFSDSPKGLTERGGGVAVGQPRAVSAAARSRLLRARGSHKELEWLAPCGPGRHLPGRGAQLPPTSSEKGRRFPGAGSFSLGVCGDRGLRGGGERASPGKPERAAGRCGRGLTRRRAGLEVRLPVPSKMHNASSPEPGLTNASCWGAAPGCPDAWSPAPLPQPLAVAVPVVYSVICAVGLVGNSAVLLVLLRAPRTKTVTNLFILNLAIADELFTLVLPVNIADFLLRRWPFGELACKLVVAIDQYNTFSSLYFLAVMSADRYLVVLAAAQSRRVAGRTYGAARAVSLAVWGVATLVVLPFAVFARLDEEQGRRQCVLVFPQPEAFWWRASRLYSLVLGFAIPVTAICVLYTTLLCRLRAIRLDSHARALDRAKKRVTLLVVAILAACLLCWTPYHLSTVVALTTDLPQTPLVIAISYLITSLSYANSCLNPFLYAFLDDGFRKSLRRLLACRGEPGPTR